MSIIQVLIHIVGYAVFFCVGYFLGRKSAVQKAHELLEYLKPWFDANPDNFNQTQWATFHRIGGVLDGIGFLTVPGKKMPPEYNLEHGVELMVLKRDKVIK